jgi:outer membrane protein assembly factor BamE (lipoprotein component of BamABCDE complex)
MQKSYLFSFICIFAALLTVALPLKAQTKLAPQYIASFDRFGPVKIGMTAAQAAKALGVSVTRDEGYEGNECYYTSPRKGFKNIAFMMNGKFIMRIDINSKDYVTDKGAKIGDTEARIKRLYKGMYKVYPHKYVDNAHDIEVRMKGGKYSIIFETDGKKVIRFRLGRTEQVGYVEGCS